MRFQLIWFCFRKGSHTGKHDFPHIFNLVVGVVVQHSLIFFYGKKTIDQGLGVDIYYKGIISYVYYRWLLLVYRKWI